MLNMRMIYMQIVMIMMKVYGKYSYLSVVYQSNVYHIKLIVIHLFNMDIYNFILICCFVCFMFTKFVLFVTNGNNPKVPLTFRCSFEATSRRSRQPTRLRRLTVRSLDHPRQTVNVNPTTGRGSGPHKEKVL